MSEKDHKTISLSIENYSRLKEWGKSKKSRSFDQTIDFIFDEIAKVELVAQ